MKQYFNTTRALRFAVLFAILLLPVSLIAQPAAQPWEDDFAGCTSIMVGKLASTDGSVITCHSCDGNYRTWLNIEPHKTHDPGTMKPIYWGLLHTETAWAQRGLVKKGEIPEVEETYAFMNVAYPCMNEKQLAIGETTIGGRRELQNDQGLFLIENLQQIVLERCTTAREAIQLIGELVKEYGYGDRGECLTFADPQEVWHFEIFGAGPFEIGAVWAAVRIPDDHVGVSANIPRINEINLDDPDHYMASENVYTLAEEMGWWDSSSGETFKFWKAYSGRRPYSTREYYILSTMAPSLNLTQEMDELPFSVKPDEKVDVRRVLAYYRETYEGTELDQTKNLTITQRDRRGNVVTDDEGNPVKQKSPEINPWMTRNMARLFNEVAPGTVETQRTIAIAGCSYSQVIQCRDWLPEEMRTVAYFSFDNPGQSPRIPIYNGTLRLPPSFEICGQHRFREDAALWSFRKANRLSQVRWGYAGEHINNAVMEFENKMFDEMPAIEKRAQEILRTDGSQACKEYLTRYTNDFAYATMSKWEELAARFWDMFGRGF